MYCLIFEINMLGEYSFWIYRFFAKMLGLKNPIFRKTGSL